MKYSILLAVLLVCGVLVLAGCNTTGDAKGAKAQCNDGKDNDADGKCDGVWNKRCKNNPDPGCIDKNDNDETDPTTTTTTTTTTSTTTTTLTADSCSDTDGGIVETIKGTVSGINYGYAYSYDDSCNSTSMVLEWYCIGDSPELMLIPCNTTECVEGACQ